MEAALAEARKAEAHGDVPIGAAIYRDGELEEYTLACKNPNVRPECPGRHKVVIPRKA